MKIIILLIDSFSATNGKIVLYIGAILNVVLSKQTKN